MPLWSLKARVRPARVAGAYVVTIDAGGAITGRNAQAEATFGWTREEAVGRMLVETIVPPEHRLAHLRRGLRGRVDVRATSARWAWVEYVLAQGGPPEGRAVLQAVRAGGRFADYERAFAALPAERPRRALRVVA